MARECDKTAVRAPRRRRELIIRSNQNVVRLTEAPDDERPQAIELIDIDQVPSVGRPAWFGLVPGLAGQPPGESGSHIGFPEVEPHAMALRRKHDAITVRVPVGMLVRIAVVAETEYVLACEAVDAQLVASSRARFEQDGVAAG